MVEKLEAAEKLDEFRAKEKTRARDQVIVLNIVLALLSNWGTRAMIKKSE